MNIAGKETMMGVHNHWKGSGPAHCKECAKDQRRSANMSIPTANEGTSTESRTSTDNPSEIQGQMTFPELAMMQKVVEDRMHRLANNDPAVIVHEQRMQQLFHIRNNQPALVQAVLDELRDGPEAAGWIKHPGGIHQEAWHSPETNSGYRSASWDVDEETQQTYVTAIHVTFKEPDDDDRFDMVWMDVNARGVLHNERTSMSGNRTVDGGAEWYMDGQLVCRTEKQGDSTRIVGPNGKRLPLLTELKLTWVIGFDLG